MRTSSNLTTCWLEYKEPKILVHDADLRTSAEAESAWAKLEKDHPRREARRVLRGPRPVVAGRAGTEAVERR